MKFMFVTEVSTEEGLVSRHKIIEAHDEDQALAIYIRMKVCGELVMFYPLNPDEKPIVTNSSLKD